MRRHVLGLALAGLALAAAATAASAECPASTILYGATDPANPVPVPASALDTTFAIHDCFDLVHARFQADAGLVLAASRGCSADGHAPSGIETVFEDDFTVTGLPAGTPIAFAAVLELQGVAESFSAPWDPGGGRIRGIVHESAANEAVIQQTTLTGSTLPVTIDQPISITVNALAGTPVRLRFAVRAESLEGRAELEGTFHFANLPAGAVITSCKGFASDGVVPAHASSWGRLKSSYR